MQKHLVAVAVGALAATNLFAAPVAVQSPDGTVKRGVVIPAKMAVGGGHAMIIRPVK